MQAAYDGDPAATNLDEVILAYPGLVAVTVYRFVVARQDLAAAIAETDRLDPGWRFDDLEAQRQLPPPAQNAGADHPAGNVSHEE